MRQAIVRAARKCGESHLSVLGAERKWVSAPRRFLHATSTMRMSSSRRREMDKERADHASGLLSKLNISDPRQQGFKLHQNQGLFVHSSDPAGVNAGRFPLGTSALGASEEKGSTWRALTGGSAALDGAEHLAGKVIDPFQLMEPQLKALSENLKGLVKSDNPVLNTVSQYFFDVPGKRFRPALVLLLAQAAPPGVISDKQQRLAEITEMIHTASLLHDDVMDHGEFRRGVPSLNSVHGNRLAILAGDFLLSRASLELARLQNVEVIELLSTVIAHLVEGEIMQSQNSAEEATSFDYYMRKTYLKTASLLAHSCMGVVLLGGEDASQRRAAELAFDYGKHLGLAFQIKDDVLDFEGDLETLGKAAGSDLREGLTTAPVLFAMDQYKHDLEPLIQRGYEGPGDAERALELVLKSDGLQKSTALAEEHSQLAIDAAEQLEPSVARDGLVQLAHLVVKRKA
mmetsp:Transcript_13053/g.26925  ORF Transcript_13053/g.26925 Transcript_13053/m.26925 type:complete len:458 (+) Transcript_13053:35-1408(+)